MCAVTETFNNYKLLHDETHILYYVPTWIKNNKKLKWLNYLQTLSYTN